MWDVEGIGLSKVPNAKLAHEILRKTDDMNMKIAKRAVGITLILGFFPEFLIINMDQLITKILSGEMFSSEMY